MDPYYYHHPILQQQYYAYAVPVSAVPADQWVVYDRVTPARYTMPIFYLQCVQYVDDVAILNTPNPMWLHQEQPMHEFEAFLEERLMRIEQQEAGRRALIQRVNTGSGLSEEEISENLYVYTAQGKMSEEDACCICLGEYEENKEKTGRLECGHRFHAECIKRWLLSKNVCPICRSTAFDTSRSLSLIMIGDVMV